MLAPTNSEFIVQAIHELGGSAKVGEIHTRVATLKGLSDDELSARYESDGSKKFDSCMSATRFQLKKDGVINNTKRGVWTLTPDGQPFRKKNRT